MMIYQKIMRREERVSQVKLISSRKKQSTHVDGQEVGAVTASNRNSLEQTSARNAHLKHAKGESHYRRWRRKGRRRWKSGGKEIIGRKEEGGREKWRKWYREDSVTKVAMDVTELVGGGGEVVRWKGRWGGHLFDSLLLLIWLIDWLFDGD